MPPRPRLQCSIPVFEDLLDEPFNTLVVTMLFELCRWHAFAKLALHSESTLSAFERATSTLGTAMRAFAKNVCPYFDTKELPKETNSRKRRKKAGNTDRTVKIGAISKVYNLFTYKYHRLGDYVRAIRLFGPTDVFNTQTVCLSIVADHVCVGRLTSFSHRANWNTAV